MVERSHDSSFEFVVTLKFCFCRPLHPHHLLLRWPGHCYQQDQVSGPLAGPGGRGVDRAPDLPPDHRAEASEPRAQGQPGHRGLERGVGEVLQDGRRPGQEGDLRQVRPQNVEGLQL